MKCREVRSDLFPYIDSELDQDRTWHIARHLEECSGCREALDRELSIERAVRDRLSSPLGDEEEVFERALAAALRAGRARASRRARISVAAAALAVLALLATLLAIVAELSGEGAGGEPPELVRAAGADHRAYEAGSLGELITPAEAASAHLRGELGLECSPRPADPGTDILGARVCSLGEQRVGYWMLRRSETPVSLFLIPAGDLDEETRLLLDGNPLHELPDGLRVLAARRGDVVVLVVAHLERASLEHLAACVL